MIWISENRKKSIIIGNVILIIIALLAIILIKNGLYKTNNTIKYDENKNLEYKVMLKQNDYYKLDYMEKGNQYIADLINIIDANFKYDFGLDNDYEYKYKIIGTIEITDDKTGRIIYKHSEDLLGEKSGTVNGQTNINENIKIDFNKYNDFVNKFVSTYDLKNVTSKLNVNLEFGATGVSKKFAKGNSTVMSLNIPLGVKTTPIDVNYSKANDDNSIILQDGVQSSKKSLIGGIILFATDIVFLVVFIIYIKLSATDEDKYNGKVRKIMNNYESYISKIDDDFNMDKYQIIKVQKFSDLLEIRDTMQLPIIMMENKEQLVTCFLIPTAANLLYFYSINVKQYALPSGRHKKQEESNKENI